MTRFATEWSTHGLRPLLLSHSATNRAAAVAAAVPRSCGYAYVRSFANIYVVMVRYSAPFELPAARAAVGAHLPEIERLTLALPPPDGPGSEGAENLMPG